MRRSNVEPSRARDRHENVREIRKTFRKNVPRERPRLLSVIRATREQYNRAVDSGTRSSAKFGHSYRCVPQTAHGRRRSITVIAWKAGDWA